VGDILKIEMMNNKVKLKRHLTFKDNRGSFTPIDCNNWEQVNISVNDKKFTFRGMHYQTSPPQTKFIKVIKGSIIDIIYNLETKESSFYILDENDALLVDEKYAHGFLTLEPNTVVSYLVKGAYNPSSEHTIYWKNVERIKKEILQICNEEEITISQKDDDMAESAEVQVK
jgi:dTDP-4-dehydrorhamnose 3,5-epimerase-like enzyme